MFFDYSEIKLNLITNRCLKTTMFFFFNILKQISKFNVFYCCITPAPKLSASVISWGGGRGQLSSSCLLLFGLYLHLWPGRQISWEQSEIASLRVSGCLLARVLRVTRPHVSKFERGQKTLKFHPKVFILGKTLHICNRRKLEECSGKHYLCEQKNIYINKRMNEFCNIYTMGMLYGS